MVKSDDEQLTAIEQGPFAELLKDVSLFNKTVVKYFPANFARAVKDAGVNVPVTQKAFRAMMVMCMDLDHKIKEIERKIAVLMQSFEPEPLVIDGKTIGKETDHWTIKRIVAGTSDPILLQAILDRDDRKSTQKTIETRLKEIELEPPAATDPPAEDSGEDGGQDESPESPSEEPEPPVKEGDYEGPLDSGANDEGAETEKTDPPVEGSDKLKTDS